jgi:acyl-CoA dehydrogenase
VNELRTMLGDVVTRLFTERVTPDVLVSAERGRWPDGLWQAVEENGLTLPIVPEARGGAGGTWSDAHVVVRAAGHHALPLPLAETIVGAWLLSEAGIDVPSGPLTVAPVQRDDTLRLARAGGSGITLSGTASRVPWGGTAGHVVVAAPLEGQTMVALVQHGAARVTADQSLAREPRDTLAFDRAPVVAAAPGGPRVPANAVRLYGALVRSAQMAGALDYLLRQSARYATERRQFGKPIGSFQVIQQNLAVLAGHAAAAGTAAANAFRAADRGDPAFEIAVAKIRAGEAAGIAASIAHQVHGAIGFTYEHALQFATRRLWSWRAEFGGEGDWAIELGRAVAERGAHALWPQLTAKL